MVKYKKRLKNLEAAQKWFDALPEKVKASLTRPGGINQRTATSA